MEYVMNLIKVDQKQENSLLWKILSIYMPPIILIQGAIGNIISFLIFIKLGKIKCDFSPKITFLYYSKLLINSMKCAFKTSDAQSSAKSSKTNLNPNTSSNSNSNNKNKIFKDTESISNDVFKIYIYLSILSIFDLCVLFFGLFNDWLIDLNLFNLKLFSSFTCKTITFLAYLSSHCSSTFIVITTSIRLLAIYCPYKSAQLTQIKSVKLITLTFLFIFCLFNLHLFWTIQLNEVNESGLFKELLLSSNFSENESVPFYDEIKNLTIISFECKIVKNTFTENIWPVADKLVYSLIPFVLIFTFNILIIVNIKKSQNYKYILYISKLKNDSSMLNDDKNEKSPLNRTNESTRHFKPNNTIVYENNKIKSASSVNTSYRIRINEANSSLCRKMYKQHSSNEIKEKIIQFKKYHLVGKKFTIMLLSVSICFLILTFPVVIIYVMLEKIQKNIDEMNDLNESNKSYDLLRNVQKMSTLLMYLNHSINFFIYFLTGARFRQQFYKSFLNSNNLKINIDCFKLFSGKKKRHEAVLYA